jgi:lipid-binding SYLF domain-containing protein
MVFAQDNTSSSSTTTTTTSGDRDAARDSQEQSQRNAHNAAADNDANMAAQEKSDAKDASTKGGENHDKVMARLDDSAKILNELLGAPDNGIPDDVFKSAKCVAVVPSMVKGGFVFGAEHGRGVATCRTAKGWSAPAPFVITGGSWGAQIGGQAVDLVMLIMNDKGMNDLLSSKFKLGANGSVAAGPVGRDASASTDWKMKAEVLTYSRTRGLFAGLTLDGAVIKQDDDSTQGLFGKQIPFREILMGKVPPPPGAETFLATVRRSKSEANATAH